MIQFIFIEKYSPKCSYLFTLLQCCLQGCLLKSGKTLGLVSIGSYRTDFHFPSNKFVDFLFQTLLVPQTHAQVTLSVSTGEQAGLYAPADSIIGLPTNHGQEIAMVIYIPLLSFENPLIAVSTTLSYLESAENA